MWNGLFYVRGNSNIPLKQWSHVAVTRDSQGTVRLFLNGRLDGEKRTFSKALESTDYPMTIGATTNALRKSTGFIDNWRVYKSCLYTSDFVPPAR